ncbi:hypothetical protein [Gaetbulibacter aestuarii]|uniref:Tellurite resistance protein TerB n=1 Tax=Gaetbulibacter aestuarii TaxID=1502358 RepID=A0ABW7MY50_9FLAO
MKSDINSWSKKELETYIFLMCANADDVEMAEELNLIKSRVNIKSFEKIYREFKNDSEDERFEKIEAGIDQHHYSHMELMELQKVMQQIFMRDSKLTMMEANLKKILNNMLY